MRAVWFNRRQPEFEAVERFVSERIWGKPRRLSGDTAMVSIKGDGETGGAVIYQNYNADCGTIEMSAAALTPRWLDRHVLHEMFAYPFEQLRCQAVVMRCDPENTRLNRIFKAFGFERHDIPRLRGRDKAEAIYILGDDTWRANEFHRRHEDG